MFSTDKALAVCVLSAQLRMSYFQKQKCNATDCKVQISVQVFIQLNFFLLF